MDLKERRGLDEQVYQPAEDSFLLASAAVDDIEAEDRVLDVGTGSGIVGEYIHEKTGAKTVGIDINPHACRAAVTRGVEAVRGDLVSPFAANSFDVIVCNPPYLPDHPDGTFDDWMEQALTGGETGRELIDQLIETMPRVLTTDGTAYLMISTLTDVDAVATAAGSRGFGVAAVAEQAYPFETLTVLKLCR